MDGSAWSGNTPPAQSVGVAFDWTRENSQGDVQGRTVAMHGLHPGQHNGNGNNNSNSNGNGNGGSNGNGNGVHSISNQGIHMSSNLANEPNMGPGGDLTSLSSNPLQQHELLRNGPGPQSPPRDEFHHHPSHIHHAQQHIHVHNPHSQYHHGQLHPQEISQEEFVTQSYGTAHYYGEPDQQDPYHDRPHSGGLVGHPYGHSPQDNIVTLTPPPSAPQTHDLPPLRTRLTNTIWEDERTYCFQVDVKGVCVARRADNNMVNGTKLLNVVGMSRGKRDGILKNEKGRVVVKVGAMHLKGVWIPLDRAVHHAKAHHIEDSLHPLLVDDPAEYLYQHPHATVVSSDMRWASQVQQVQHNLYHDSHESPKSRSVDMHSNHHFNQGPHGDYYSQQQHQPFFRHGASRHGSPHGSNGSISGDEDPNLASPFEYRLQSSMASGGLIGMPSSGSSAPLDARSGGHHQPYYGHQTSPTQYYHAQQLGGPLANDSPPMSAGLHQDQHGRIQTRLLSGQKRGYGSNNPESNHPYYGYSNHGPSEQAIANPTGNFSPPLSLTPTEPHSPMNPQLSLQQQEQQQVQQPQQPQQQLSPPSQSQSQPQSQPQLQHHNTHPDPSTDHLNSRDPLNPPSKRPRQISRVPGVVDMPISSTGSWYRESAFERTGGQPISTAWGPRS